MVQRRIRTSEATATEAPVTEMKEKLMIAICSHSAPKHNRFVNALFTCHDGFRSEPDASDRANV